ncbi:MAG TPA: hypothetical protein VGO00_29155 [Kofleriaceae bacterium]|jgi:hypothetical protein|nr:hypothetical protein [Kofleriaceae bacterium]
MRVIVALVLVVAACQRTHELQVLLGPTPDTPSAGFLCKQDADPTKFLLQRPDVLVGKTVMANVVVDIVSLGGHLPGCRGEEIVAACTPGTCTLAVDHADRYCRPIAFDVSLASNRPALMAQITSALAAQPITTDAPNGPVLLRAVVTSQSCDDVHTGKIDPTLAVGCAYSCPAVLDDIDGPISLSLDVLDDQCEPTVRACAGFQN